MRFLLTRRTKKYSNFLSSSVHVLGLFICVFLHPCFTDMVPSEPGDNQAVLRAPFNKSWSDNTNFLVVVNHFDFDVSWAQKLRHPHIVYYKNRPDKEPLSAANKAKAETNLLKFIADFYHELPENVVIVHQYDVKPYSHHGSLVDIINDESFESRYKSSKTPGFWNFNRKRPDPFLSLE